MENDKSALEQAMNAFERKHRRNLKATWAIATAGQKTSLLILLGLAFVAGAFIF